MDILFFSFYLLTDVSRETSPRKPELSLTEDSATVWGKDEKRLKPAQTRYQQRILGRKIDPKPGS